MGLHGLLQKVLALVAVHLQRSGKGRAPLDQRVVHERLTYLERMSHAGAVDLGVDVAVEVSLDVQVLHQAQRVIRGGAAGVAAKRLLDFVAAELGMQLGGEQLAAHRLAHQ